MTWKRGLFRLWLIGTAVWLIGWALLIRHRCTSAPDGTLLCRHEGDSLQELFGQFAAWTFLQVYLLGLCVPIVVLVVGGGIAALVSARQRGRPRI